LTNDSTKKLVTISHDGIQVLRFFAISWVVGFHFFSRWSHLFPYGQIVDNMFFDVGWLGVNLFFIISGYVIGLSLQKTVKFRVFAKKRILRLLPSLFIILPLIYVVNQVIAESPFKEISTIPNLIISLFLIPPSAANLLLDLHLNWITLVLWSLKVEVIFYLLISLIYFSLAKKRTFEILVSVSILSTFALVANRLDFSFGPMDFFYRTVIALGWNHLSWFLVGLALQRYAWNSVANRIKIFSLILFSHIPLLIEGQSLDVLMCGLTMSILTAITIVWARVLPKHWRPLVVLGNSSYEMYLLHQNIGVTISLKLSSGINATSSSSLIIVLLSIASSFLLSHYIFRIILIIRRRFVWKE